MSRLGGARPRGSFEVVELGPNRCRFVSRYQPEVSGTLLLLRPMLVRWLKRQRRVDTQRLKRLLEGASATPDSQPVYRAPSKEIGGDGCHHCAEAADTGPVENTS
jgi:hypothetical protein